MSDATWTFPFFKTLWLQRLVHTHVTHVTLHLAKQGKSKQGTSGPRSYAKKFRFDLCIFRESFAQSAWVRTGAGTKRYTPDTPDDCQRPKSKEWLDWWFCHIQKLAGAGKQKDLGTKKTNIEKHGDFSSFWSLSWNRESILKTWQPSKQSSRTHHLMTFSRTLTLSPLTRHNKLPEGSIDFFSVAKHWMKTSTCFTRSHQRWTDGNWRRMVAIVDVPLAFHLQRVVQSNKNCTLESHATSSHCVY